MIVLAYFTVYLSSLIFFIIKGVTPLKAICLQFQAKANINTIETKGDANIETNNKEEQTIENKEETEVKIRKVKRIRKKLKTKSNPPKRRSTKVNIKHKKNKFIKHTNDIEPRRNKSFKALNNFLFQNALKNNMALKTIDDENNKNDIKDNNNNDAINNENLNINNNPYNIYNDSLNLNSNKEINVLFTSHNHEHNQNNDTKEKNEEDDLSSYELNKLVYEDFIKYDKRTFLQIYWSLLKREDLLIFTFFAPDDYNLLYVKIARFIHIACTDMALNVFFFSDDSMNKIYLTYGKYDFIQKIPQMVYSVIVSLIIELILCFLSMTDKYMYRMKKLKEKNFDAFNKVLRIIKIKLIIFFIFTILLFIFYWYIISAFCAVYKNTQIIFIKDSVFSFIAGLIYPFILYLIPAVLRIICLKYKDKDMKILYKLSYILPFF